ncbi:MAG: hypothetical protein Q8N73_00480, partial [bacterium]|nr:hypothetical protein [bacterium]
KKLEIVGEKVLNNLIFHLGLIELLSYWKTTCSPEIIIKAGFLNSEQLSFWKDLIIKGMGQFFYENKINFHKPNFIRIISAQKDNRTRTFLLPLKNRVLVPVGGGKDSIVTLEILKKAKKELNSFLVNPTKAAKKVVKIAGIKKPIIVQRKIDPILLQLNKKGYLNGHTPFTAVLSFLSVFCAVLFDYKNIAFSNEKSADEGNVKYLGKIINHQYSKTSEFERKFKNYCKKYLAKNINYFSFSRPYTELEISKMFTKYPKYFLAFSSCNRASKIGERWCGNCPKCLFVFATIYPFLDEKKLIKIFGKNLFKKKELLPIMQELIGERGFKPFECVGTKKETLAAFYLSWKKNRDPVSIKLPFLLEYFEKKILPKHPNLRKESIKILNSWNNQNNLPKELKKILKVLLLTEIE